METQQAILARAKQGHTDAIAILLNRTLNQYSASATVRRCGGEYQLLVESEQVPNQPVIVRGIEQSLAKIASAEIQSVTIYGKSSQQAQSDWQYRRCFDSSTPSEVNLPTVLRNSSQPEPNQLAVSFAAGSISQSADSDAFEWVLPVVWTVCLLVAIVLGISSISGADNYRALCAETDYPMLCMSASSARQASRVYGVFIDFGTSTLFTGIGVVLAVIFCPVYSCYSLKGVYRIACFLGMIETLIVSFLSNMGLLLFAPIQTMIAVYCFCTALDVFLLMFSGLIFKDFKIDWDQGFARIAQGAFIIMGARLALSLMLYGIISQFTA